MSERNSAMEREWEAISAEIKVEKSSKEFIAMNKSKAELFTP